MPHIWTETPLSEVWRQLGYLRSSANVLNLLSGRLQSKRQPLVLSGDALESRAAAVTGCIQQAGEYFHASEDVSIVTQPLLLFYSAEALAKAVILANNPSIFPEDIKYHGLSSRWKSAPEPLQESLKLYSTVPSTWNLEEEFAVANEGVFPELCKIMGDTVPHTRTVFRLKELWRALPDLSESYRQHYGDVSHCFYLYGEPTFDSEKRFAVSFSREVNMSDVRAVFPEFDQDYVQTEKRGINGFRSSQAITSVPTFGSVERGTVAGKYFVRPHASGVRKSFPLMFASLFILSNIVRYKPAFWMETVRGTRTGSIALVESSCTYFKRRIPEDALNALWNDSFTFGSPGYLS